MIGIYNQKYETINDQRKFTIYELEILAVVEALTKYWVSFKNFFESKIKLKNKLGVVYRVHVLSNRKKGNQECLLDQLHIEETPLHTFHIENKKNYKHILAVVDLSTKFCWLYPLK